VTFLEAVKALKEGNCESIRSCKKFRYKTYKNDMLIRTVEGTDLYIYILTIEEILGAWEVKE
jgi:hypothetical protein